MTCFFHSSCLVTTAAAEPGPQTGGGKANSVGLAPAAMPLDCTTHDITYSLIFMVELRLFPHVWVF